MDSLRAIPFCKACVSRLTECLKCMFFAEVGGGWQGLLGVCLGGVEGLAGCLGLKSFQGFRNWFAPEPCSTCMKAPI